MCLVRASSKNKAVSTLADKFKHSKTRTIKNFIDIEGSTVYLEEYSLNPMATRLLDHEGVRPMKKRKMGDYQALMKDFNDHDKPDFSSDDSDSDGPSR